MKIILASKSKARFKLLKDLGLKIDVVPPLIKESRKLKNKCSDLVIDNAVRKANDVAKRVPAGIIIAADTLVLVGSKIIGKPKNKKDAFKVLKLLSKNAQWVYTGIAVLNKDKNRLSTAYDKTKVYMYPLSDEDIKKYISKSLHVEKAGSFDIQGQGGVFIRRIEGCFYNVVGLSLGKLAKILKKEGISIF